jgi:hypothetical protein
MIGKPSKNGMLLIYNGDGDGERHHWQHQEKNHRA